jgi:DnaJ family protein A protein 5
LTEPEIHPSLAETPVIEDTPSETATAASSQRPPDISKKEKRRAKEAKKKAEEEPQPKPARSKGRNLPPPKPNAKDAPIDDAFVVPKAHKGKKKPAEVKQVEDFGDDKVGKVMEGILEKRGKMLDRWEGAWDGRLDVRGG